MYEYSFKSKISHGQQSCNDDVDKVISNGFYINYNAKADTLSEYERGKFALQLDHCIFIGRDKFEPGQIVVKGGAGWTEEEHLSDLISSSAVWTLGLLLSLDECD